jgi:hypothetical protein
MDGSPLIYPEVQSCRAVIIDSNPVTRGLLADMLAQVTQCGKLLDGRRAIEAKVFDIILCEYNFPNSPASGQDLLDDLRRSQLLAVRLQARSICESHPQAEAWMVPTTQAP